MCFFVFITFIRSFLTFLKNFFISFWWKYLEKGSFLFPDVREIVCSLIMAEVGINESHCRIRQSGISLSFSFLTIWQTSQNVNNWYLIWLYQNIWPDHDLQINMLNLSKNRPEWKMKAILPLFTQPACLKRPSKSHKLGKEEQTWLRGA